MICLKKRIIKIDLGKIFLLYTLLFCHFLFPYIQDGETCIKKYTKPVEIQNASSGIDLVDCIYIINLDERPDRWKSVVPRLDAHDLRGNRVSAVNGWKLSRSAQKEICGNYSDRLNGGHLGALLSHLSALLDAEKRGFNLIWVLEDDVEFVKSPSVLPLLIKDLEIKDPEWDIFFTDPDSRDGYGNYIRVAATDPRPDQPIQSIQYYMHREQITDDIMRIRSRYGMYSALISKRGIRKMVEYFTHVIIWSPIDVDMHYIPGIREYASLKDIVIPIVSLKEFGNTYVSP